MRRISTIFLAAALMLSMAACGGNENTPRGEETTPPSSTPTQENSSTAGVTKEDMLTVAEEVSLIQLRNDFYDNKVKATAKYVGNAYLVSGYVADIEADYCRLLLNDTYTTGITIHLQQEDLLLLNRNDRITVVGTIGEEMDAWSSETAGSTFSYEYPVMNPAFYVDNTYEITGTIQAFGTDSDGKKWCTVGTGIEGISVCMVYIDDNIINNFNEGDEITVTGNIVSYSTIGLSCNSKMENAQLVE